MGVEVLDRVDHAVVSSMHGHGDDEPVVERQVEEPEPQHPGVQGTQPALVDVRLSEHQVGQDDGVGESPRRVQDLGLEEPERPVRSESGENLLVEPRERAASVVEAAEHEVHQVEDRDEQHDQHEPEHQLLHDPRPSTRAEIDLVHLAGHDLVADVVLDGPGREHVETEGEDEERNGHSQDLGDRAACPDHRTEVEGVAIAIEDEGQPREWCEEHEQGVHGQAVIPVPLVVQPEVIRRLTQHLVFIAAGRPHRQLEHVSPFLVLLDPHAGLRAGIHTLRGVHISAHNTTES